MDHKTILEKANAAIAAGNNEEFLSFCTDDTHWTFVGDRVIDGKAEVRRWLADEYAAGPPENNVTDMIAEGDFLTVVGELRLTDKDGRIHRYSYCDVWRFRGDKLSELRAFVIETANS